jgi:hypothetical protein
MRSQAQENKVDYSTSSCYYSAHEPAEMGAGRPEPQAQTRLGFPGNTTERHYDAAEPFAD